MMSYEPRTAFRVEDGSTLSSDPSMSARWRRREMRLSKKPAFALGSSRGLNLMKQGVLKRAGTCCNSLYWLEGCVEEENDGESRDLLSMLTDKQGFCKLDLRSGLARSRSCPPEGWQTSKYILQISKVGCPPSEPSEMADCSRGPIVKDELSLVSHIRAAPCATDIVHASLADASFTSNPHPTQINNSLHSASNNVGQERVPVQMHINKNLARTDTVVQMPNDQRQATSSIAPNAVADALYLAGKAALLQNVEGSLPVPIRLEVKQLSTPDCTRPPSAKVLICGRRREMEDTAVIVPSFTQIPRGALGSKMAEGQLIDLHFYGVYDGHGGSQVSSYCAKRLHHALAEEVVRRPINGDNSNSRVWQSAMSSCFMTVDKEVGGVCPYGACDVVDSSAGCCVGSIAPENAGTTALVAVVNSSQIILANCGDSRAVLSRGGKSIPLSHDHKPEREDETCRIEAAGGQIIYWKGYRVGALLALSRAIGDRYLKRYVISEPEVTCLQRSEQDEFLILASDGLWDVFDNEMACDVVRRCLSSSRGSDERRVTSRGDDYASASAAATLVKLACGKGSQDNITVVVIDLRRRKN